MASNSIAKLLGETPELKPLAARLARIRSLQKRYRNLVPAALAEASRVCAIDGNHIVICASNGPVAAVLRQLAPRLLEELRSGARESSKHSTDQELNGIRIEVQVAATAPRRPVKGRPPPPPAVLEAIARDLSDSPLKETLRRMTRK